jgi:uncharacterized protein (TIGR02145 family)
MDIKTVTKIRLSLVITGTILAINCNDKELVKVTKLDTGTISNITYNSATATATFIDLSGNITSYGHCWNTAGNPTTSDFKFTVSGTAQKGDYTSILTGLDGNTKYFVKAYAVDGESVVYGNEVSFITGENPFINVEIPSIDYWITGHSYDISWTHNITENVIIQLLKGENVVLDIEGNDGINCNSSPYNWTIPENNENIVWDSDYHIRIKSIDNNTVGISDVINIAVKPKDFDGNYYDIIKIGNQWWMKENLKTTKYSNSISIPHVTSDASWSELTTAAYCWYNNDISYKDTYGALYNHFAVYVSSICPTGWHIPSDDEWSALEVYLQNNGYNWDGYIDSDNDRSTNNKIAKSLATNTGWAESTVYGAVGRQDMNYGNKSGFSAIPAGARGASSGTFGNAVNSANWWSSTIVSTDYPYSRFLNYNSAAVGRTSPARNNGLSVRCLKNN